MSPLDLAIGTVERAVAAFHPKSMPLMLRANYARELAAGCFLPIALGAVEGGVVGVIAKTYFAGAASERTINFAVAVLAGAPAFANVVNFLWAALSHGRPKIRMLTTLQATVAVCVGVVALVPRTGAGLVLLAACVVLARVGWSGVITLRSTVWRANYPRTKRARLAGRLAMVQAMLMSLTALLVGLAMKTSPDAFRFIYPVAAVCGLFGAWIYRGVRMRGRRAWLRAELEDGESQGSLVNPLQLRRVLLDDPKFRRYMTAMFVFGTGNLMVTPLLVIMLKDRFHLDPFVSILIVATLPTLLMPASIPAWSRLLDRVHVIRFRAVHSWSFVASTGCMFLAAVAMQPWLLFVGAAFKGLAFGGGVLGWNLGHHDFAPPERASQYMGVHVTLTGVRGLLAPVIGVSLYEILEWLEPGAGAWALALCLTLSLAGAVWFVLMRQDLQGPGGGSELADGPPLQPPAAG